jgi:hypothetical protein
MTFAALTFLSPYMLAGMAALALPIAAHLFHRRTRLVITFPTIRLLAESARRRSRLSALRRRLLLLLRCLALAAAVLAFARPIWSSPGDLIASRQGVALVIVLDNSASSAQRIAGVALLDALKVRAQRALDGLRPGIDWANVVTTAPSPRALLPAATNHPEALSPRVSRVTTSEAHGDLAAALSLADQQAQNAGGSPRVVVLSDLQATQWAGVTARPRQDAGPMTRVATAGEGGVPNVGLSAPTIYPAQPWPGQRVQLGCVVNNSSAAARQVLVTASLDGEPVGSRPVTVEPWSSASAVFGATITRAGPQRITFGMDGGDALAVDDTVFLVATTGPAMRVLLVTDEPLRPPNGAYFTARALAPTAEGPLRVRTIASAGVSLTALAGADIAVIAGANPLPAAASRAVAGFVSGGGGLIAFLDREAAVATLSAINDALPSAERFTVLPNAPRGENQTGWRIAPPPAPPIPGFTAGMRALGEALRPATFHAAYPFKDPAAPGQIRYDDGGAALVWKPAGHGHIAVCNFGASPDASDLATHGGFVALMHELCDQVSRAADTDAPLPVGSPLRFNVPPAAPAASVGEMEIIAPNGRPLAQNGLSNPPAELAGFYRLKRGPATLAWAAVNPDPRESDLRRVSLAAAQAAVSSTPGPADDGSAPRALKGSVLPSVVELWPVCLAVAAAMLLIELTLLVVWKD